jgi:putative redox protein
MKMDIRFPGGVGVNAQFKGFTVATDQSREHGGSGAAPEPFDLFLSAIGTCAGFYALRFCQERGIDTNALSLTLSTEPDPERRRLAAIRIETHLPAGFPEKYRAAILRAIDQCAVKRHIVDPPRFELAATYPALAPVAA